MALKTIIIEKKPCEKPWKITKIASVLLGGTYLSNNQTLVRCSLLINAPMFVATSLGEPTLSSLHEIAKTSKSASESLLKCEINLTNMVRM